MEIKEAIERIKTMHYMCDDFYNCKYGHDCTVGCSEAVKMAVKALEEVEKRGSNMVISSVGVINTPDEDCKRSFEAGYTKGYETGYARGVDDFSKEIIAEYDNDGCPNVSDYLDYKISIRDLEKIAEELKGGAV